MKKPKRKLKGITLFEIIISLAVVAVMTLLMYTVSSTINTYIRASKNVNKKIAQQAPAAEVDYVNSAVLIDDNVKIRFGYGFPKNADGTFKWEGVPIELTGKAYAIDDPNDLNKIKAEDHIAGDQLNLKFITEIETPTAPPS